MPHVDFSNARLKPFAILPLDLCIVKVRISTILRLSTLTLLLLYLSLPTTLQLLKIGGLVLLTLISVFSSKNSSNIIYPKNIVSRLGLLILCLLPFYIYSFFVGNPGAALLFRSQILLPVILIFCAFNLTRYTSLKDLVLICSISSIFILFVQLLLFVIPQQLSFVTYRSGSVQEDSLFSIVNLSYAGIKAQYFLLPFLSLLATLNIQNKIYIVNRKLISFAIFTSFFSLILGISGSSIVTILYTLVISSVVWIYTLYVSLGHKKVKLPLALVSILMILLVPVAIINNFHLIEYLVGRVFSSTGQILDVGDQIRLEQEIKLTAKFLEDPIFGSSIGYDNGLNRGMYPWESELLYHSLLSQFGLVGFISLISFGGYYILHTVPVLIKKFINGLSCNYEVLSIRSCYIVALINVIVISSKNPNLASFENCFVFYLPFFFVSMLSHKSLFQK